MDDDDENEIEDASENEEMNVIVHGEAAEGGAAAGIADDSARRGGRSAGGVDDEQGVDTGGNAVARARHRYGARRLISSHSVFFDVDTHLQHHALSQRRRDSQDHFDNVAGESSNSLCSFPSLRGE